VSLFSASRPLEGQRGRRRAIHAGTIQGGCRPREGTAGTGALQRSPPGPPGTPGTCPPRAGLASPAVSLILFAYPAQRCAGPLGVRSMFRSLFARLFSPRKVRRSGRPVRPARRHPLLEQLEDRTVPPVLDLTASAGLTGILNNAIFTGVYSGNFNTSTGTGVIQPFLRVQDTPVEQGFNTEAAKPQI